VLAPGVLPNPPRAHSAPPRPFLQCDDPLTNCQLLTPLSGEPARCTFRADSPDPFRDFPEPIYGHSPNRVCQLLSLVPGILAVDSAPLLPPGRPPDDLSYDLGVTPSANHAINASAETAFHPFFFIAIWHA